MLFILILFIRFCLVVTDSWILSTSRALREPYCLRYLPIIESGSKFLQVGSRKNFKSVPNIGRYRKQYGSLKAGEVERIQLSVSTSSVIAESDQQNKSEEHLKNKRPIVSHSRYLVSHIDLRRLLTGWIFPLAPDGKVVISDKLHCIHLQDLLLSSIRRPFS